MAFALKFWIRPSHSIRLFLSFRLARWKTTRIMDQCSNCSTVQRQNGLDSLSNANRFGLLALIIMIMLISVVGNTLILYTLYKVQSLRSMSSALVANLAVNDLCMSVFILPTIALVIIERGWTSSLHLCSAVGFLDSIVTKAQVMALLCIGINRFIAVRRPTFYSSAKSKRFCKYCVIFGWFYSIAWSLPPLFGLGEYSYIDNKLFCGLTFNTSYVFEPMNILATAILPGIAGLIIYSIVLIGVFRHIRQVNSTLGKEVFELKEMKGDSVHGTPTKEVRQPAVDRI